ncbi:hypothetical protein E8E13_004804 [Curvularia kusanoi]|uniref:Phospholipase D/nuclease n=1 Tax=Curvularia kusanoi TaxID=90978 RepID=A0A9P4TBU4_CURKU|nr:hypothetical protein E8E13_004804 [Curvularia kusanoi]
MRPSKESGVAPAKRRKLNDATTGEAHSASASLKRPVSPPLSSRQTPVPAALLQAAAATWNFDDVPKQTETLPSQQPPFSQPANESVSTEKTAIRAAEDQRNADDLIECIASPFQLTRIRDLAPHQNVDTVQLKDILGDPMIRECWNFNFLFDIDFVVQQFDEDVRDSVKIKIVHGFWRKDDERRINLLEMAEKYSNVELINAYLPDPFGTHHSKMLVLLRHDDHAQVIIHTANMIPKDWTNMTQAVWQSPLLPVSTDIAVPKSNPIGSGHRFRSDLLRYLNEYGKRLQKLTDQLALYNFAEIRAAFLSSAPSRTAIDAANPSSQTSFGWLGLQEILSQVPITAPKDAKKPPHIVLQVSSIATLGPNPTWLSNLQSVLAQSHSAQQTPPPPNPKFSIIFPTAEEVRTSLDGYASGGSIHTKIQSPQQQKQLQYLHPLLCHWKHQPPSPSPSPRPRAHRGPAAPHIKTYIRYTSTSTSTSHTTIDWALLTSANLSKQAWGDTTNKEGILRIQSFETGVLVWPDLFTSTPNGGDGGVVLASMIPVFGKDMPGVDDAAPLTEPAIQIPTRGVGEDEDDEEEETEDEAAELAGDDDDDEETEDEQEEIPLGKNKNQNPGKSESESESESKGKTPYRSTTGRKRILIGLRMPYDLPLSPYRASEVPWCATQRYSERDWKGCTWGGF